MAVNAIHGLGYGGLGNTDKRRVLEDAVALPAAVGHSKDDLEDLACAAVLPVAGSSLAEDDHRGELAFVGLADIAAVPAAAGGGLGNNHSRQWEA